MNNFSSLINLLIFALVIGGPIISAIAKHLREQSKNRQAKIDAERRRLESLRTGNFDAEDAEQPVADSSPYTRNAGSGRSESGAAASARDADSPHALAERRRAQLEEVLRRRRELLERERAKRELERAQRQTAPERPTGPDRGATPPSRDVLVRAPGVGSAQGRPPGPHGRAGTGLPGGLSMQPPATARRRTTAPQQPIEATEIARSGPDADVDIASGAIATAERALLARLARLDDRGRDPLGGDDARSSRRPRGTSPDADVTAMLSDRSSLRRAIVLAEVLGPPRSLRED